MGNKVKEDHAKKDEESSVNAGGSTGKNKFKIRKKIKGKSDDGKCVDVRLLKSMIPSKHQHIVSSACDLILQKQKKKALKSSATKKLDAKKSEQKGASTSKKPEDENQDIMEWEPTESEVMTSLQEIRQSTIHLNSTCSTALVMDVSQNWMNKSIQLNVVIDTNIFLCHLPTVKMLVEDKDLKGKVCIHIAWMVLQELDYMKTNNEKKNKLELLARKAAKFIYEWSKQEGNLLRIQTLQEFKDSCIALPIGSNSDDRILQWCLELKQSHQSVILLSNDMNFGTKSSACGIQAFTREQFLNEVPNLLNSSTEKIVEIKVPISVSPMAKNPETASRSETATQAIEKEATFLNQLESCLTEPLGKLLHDEMKKVYEDMWQTIVLVKPPWKLLDIIRCIDKHWIAVFSYVYPKDWRESLHYLKATLYQSKTSLLDVDRRHAVLEKSISILRVIQSCRKEYHEYLNDRIRSLERFREPLTNSYTDSSMKPPIKLNKVLELFTMLWSHLNDSCGIILDVTHVEHQLQYEPSGILPSYDQVISSLQLLLSVLPPMESSMSHFVMAANHRDHQLDPVAVQFASCIVTVLDRLELNFFQELNLTLTDLSSQLVDFVRTETNQRLMENGLHQLRNYIDLLKLATGRCLPVAFHS